MDFTNATFPLPSEAIEFSDNSDSDIKAIEKTGQIEFGRPINSISFKIKDKTN